LKTDDQLQKEARRQVRHMRHFYQHLTTYGVVILFLHILNLLTSSYYWAIWPTLGWGVTIALHAARIYGFAEIFDDEWEERKVQELLAKKKGRQA
jgi:2TM domain